MPPRKRSRSRLRRGAPWTTAELEQLGIIPDSVLARRAERTIAEVVAMREERRISLPAPPRRWSARESRMLGRYADRELARRLGRPRKQLHDERPRLKIPPFRATTFQYWKPAEQRLVGKFRDEEVAARTGHTLPGVRTRLGIPNPFNQFRPWTPQESALLGRIPDEEIARKTGRPLAVTSGKRSKPGLPKPNALRKYWTPEEERLLGTARDSEVARRLQRTVGSIKNRRTELKISSWRSG